MEVEKQAGTALAKAIETQLQAELRALMQEMSQRAMDICTELCSKRFAEALEEDRTANVRAAAVKGADFKAEEAARASAAMLVSAAAVFAGGKRDVTVQQVTSTLAPKESERALYDNELRSVQMAKGKSGKGKRTSIAPKGKEGGKEGVDLGAEPWLRSSAQLYSPGGKQGKDGKGPPPGDQAGHPPGQLQGKAKGKGKAQLESPPKGVGQALGSPRAASSLDSVSEESTEPHVTNFKGPPAGFDGKQGKGKGKRPSKKAPQRESGILDLVGLGGLFG